MNEREEVGPCPPVNATASSSEDSAVLENGAEEALSNEAGTRVDATTSTTSTSASDLDPDEGALGSSAAADQEDAGPASGQKASQASPARPGVHALRALFCKEPAVSTPVRRTKSEGHVRAACSGSGQWAVPEVCTNATQNDQLWSKMDLGSHRDSVSSSSSLSSNDTVIDLSLPNLARKSLPGLNVARDDPEEGWAGQPRSAMAGYGYGAARVTKSKSNPNLRGGEDADELEDELQPRPLAKEPRDPGRLAQRRHTWSRLYMEGLRQASSVARKPPLLATGGTDVNSKSKSLGDLTSDDIACNFDSKYRSISRSFITRPAGDRRRPHRRTQDDLAEQLRRLTDVEPLTASDFTPLDREAEPEEEEEAIPLRRTSSRSQSRVRYIANRAKQAQERQRLQGLSRQNGSPIEERGNPEGACSVARSPCAGLDLLSQLAPTPPIQSSPRHPDTEVFFMLKL